MLTSSLDVQIDDEAPAPDNLQAITVDRALTLTQRKAIMDAALGTNDQDAEKFLQKVALRMAR